MRRSKRGVVCVVTACAIWFSVICGLPASAAPKKGGSGTTPSATADLMMSGSLAQRQYGIGDFITFRLKVLNKGPDPANNVKVADSFDPAHLEFAYAAWASDGVSCSATFGSITCDFGTVHAYWEHGVDLTFRAKGEALTTTISANTSSSAADPNASNNSVSFSIPIYFQAGCTVYNRIGIASSPQCSTTFTVSTTREVDLKIREWERGFSGVITTTLSDGNGTVEILAAVFQFGLPVGVGSKPVTLKPGTWTLSVRMDASGVYVSPVIIPSIICIPRFFIQVCPFGDDGASTEDWYKGGSGSYFGYVIARSLGS